MKKKTENSTRAELMRSLWGGLLQLLLGVVLLLNPDFGSNVVSTVIGWVLIVVGVVGVAVCVLCWPELKLMPALVGIAGVGLGIYILANPLALAKLFGLFAGVYLMVQGGSTLFQSRLLRKIGYHYLTGRIMGFVMLALGLVLVLCPLTAARWIMTVFGVLLVASGLVNLVIRLWAAKKLRQPPQDPNIIDAEQ